MYVRVRARALVESNTLPGLFSTTAPHAGFSLCLSLSAVLHFRVFVSVSLLKVPILTPPSLPIRSKLTSTHETPKHAMETLLQCAVDRHRFRGAFAFTFGCCPPSLGIGLRASSGPNGKGKPIVVDKINVPSARPVLPEGVHIQRFMGVVPGRLSCRIRQALDTELCARIRKYISTKRWYRIN